jgi:hypothetical protein
MTGVNEIIIRRSISLCLRCHFSTLLLSRAHALFNNNVKVCYTYAVYTHFVNAFFTVLHMLMLILCTLKSY